MIVSMMPVVGRGELWLIHLAKKSRVNWARKDPEKIKKAASDRDNGIGDCVDENGIPFEKNRLNMKVLAEKKWSPHLNIGEIFV